MNIFNLLAPIYNQIHFGAQKTFRKIFTLGDFKITDKVLDLGGGAGRIANFFVEKVNEITVVDASQNMISQCQKQKGVTCVLASADDLPMPENSFDKIIVIDAFHHFHDQKKATEQIHRLLKPGGKIIIEEFNPNKFLGWLAAKIEKITDPKSNFYSPASLAGFFKQYGFKTKLKNEKRLIYYLIGDKI